MSISTGENFIPYEPRKTLPINVLKEHNKETARIKDEAEVIELVEFGKRDTLIEFSTTLSSELALKNTPKDIYCPLPLAESFIEMRKHSDEFDQETQQVVATTEDGLFMLEEPVKKGVFSYEEGAYRSGKRLEVPEGFEILADVHSHPRGAIAIDSGIIGEMSEEVAARQADNFSEGDLLDLLTIGAEEPNKRANTSILVGPTHVTMLVRTADTPQRINNINSKKNYKKMSALRAELAEILQVDLDKAVHPQNLANLVKLRDKYGLAVYRMDLRKEGLNIWKKI